MANIPGSIPSRPATTPSAFGHDQRFERIVSALHEAALDDAAWPPAAALIDAAGAMHSNHVFVVEQRSGGALEHVFGSWRSHGAALTALERQYAERHFGADARVPRLLRMPAGSLIHTTDLGGRDNDATPPGVAEQVGADQLMTRLDGLDGLHVIWTVSRRPDQGAWRRVHIDALRRLLPHLRGAVRARQALAKAEARAAALRMLVESAQAAAGLLLDRRGQVVESSERKRGLLADDGTLAVRDGAPSVSSNADSAALARLLAAALPQPGRSPAPGAMALTGGGAGAHIRVRPVLVPKQDFGARRVAALLTLEHAGATSLGTRE